MILALKKVMLSALSSRLVISEQSMADQTRWGYEAQETGHEGKIGSINEGLQCSFVFKIMA